MELRRKLGTRRGPKLAPGGTELSPCVVSELPKLDARRSHAARGASLPGNPANVDRSAADESTSNVSHVSISYVIALR